MVMVYEKFTLFYLLFYRQIQSQNAQKEWISGSGNAGLQVKKIKNSGEYIKTGKTGTKHRLNADKTQVILLFIMYFLSFFLLSYAFLYILLS